MHFTPRSRGWGGSCEEFSWETSTFVVNAQHVLLPATAFRQFSWVILALFASAGFSPVKDPQTCLPPKASPKWPLANRKLFLR